MFEMAYYLRLEISAILGTVFVIFLINKLF